MARGNRKDWEFYLNMNLVEFFNEMAFRKDKKKNDSEFVLKLIKGKSAEESNVLLLAYIAQWQR